MKKKLVVIGVSSLLIGIGINAFILPLHLLNGGIFGISLLLKYLFDFKLGHLIILLNTPIYLLALAYDKSFFINGLLGMFITSIVIDLLLPLNGMIHLPILVSAILGGILIGLGAGLLLRHDISPGGIDLLALLLSKWYSINPGFFIFFIDTIIIVSGIAILHDVRLLYSIFIIVSAASLISMITSYKSISIYLK
jgi:uncharacterized membrane-anchored protein YitT (DUF2179 family)